MSGIAIRHAATLGLNLRNEDSNIKVSSKEVRYCVWWALCSTERMLAVMTGRPTSFLDLDCSTPLPLPVEESTLSTELGGDSISADAARNLRRFSSQGFDEPEPIPLISDSPIVPSKAWTLPRQSMRDASAAVPPSDALYFFYSTRLSVLANVILNRLYRVETSKQTWAEIQSRIAALDAKLDSWQHSLPPIFEFSKKQREPQFTRHRICLGLFYYSTRIIVNRPCLCRVDRRISNESGKAKEFNRAAAARCVHAARELMDMLPDEPNVRGLYRVSPWWCLVHYLVQGATVLMLELSFRADHMPNEAEEIFEAAKKALYWLRRMSEDNLAAQRAWKMCHHLLRKVAPKIGRNADDVPDSIPGPTTDTAVQETPINTSSSRFPTQPSNAARFDRGHGLMLQPQVYSTYDDWIGYSNITAEQSPPQFTSIFASTTEMDAVLSGGAGDFDTTFIDGEQHWDVEDEG